ncbi:MAG TPA: spore cortex biosynthesis protein YabQ [Firmicutes bacterium]|nr:spore cortex biosynthesis protein YabQ [Bacillota bacterium]
MTEPISAQLAVFVLTVAIGTLLGVLFDLYRVARGRLRPGKLGTVVGDLLFWLVATGLTFALLIAGNRGELRLYVWVGFLSGAFAYHFLFSRRVIGMLVAVLTAAECLVGAAASRGARLLRLPGEWSRRFWRRTRLGQALQKWWRWVREAPPPPR